MKTTKKLLSICLCLVICFAFTLINVSAAPSPKITISNHDVMPGDEVTITISISDNPGIMAMAFCITYDSDSLVYQNYSKGYLASCTIKDHPDKGHVSFVNVENKDNSTNGTIISVLFKVKPDAKPGKHVITLANSNRDKHGTKLHNSFSNSKQEFVIPKLISGGITVAETCDNAGHKYSAWNIVYPATCTTDGLRDHICERCQNYEEEVIPAAHDFEADWTVDKAATPEEDGEMSRHCTKCDQVTDKITFKYEEIGGDDDDTSSDDMSNDVSSEIPSDNNSSEEVSSDESDTATSDTSDNTQSSTSIETTPNKKPVINNVVGEKVPLTEVEKFEDYQQNVKPNLDNNISDNDASSEDVSSNVESDNTTSTIGPIENNSINKTDKEPSYFSTPGGIITIVLCSLLSVGILVLAVLLILRNKKSNE